VAREAHPLLEIVRVFAPLSLLSFGGGQAIVADVRHQSVDVHHWVSNAQFLNDFVLGRMNPGPNTMMVALISWSAAGWLGALVGMVAIFLPSSLLVYGVAHVWARQRGAAWQGYVERGLGPVAVGMMLGSSYNLLSHQEGGVFAWIVALGAAAILMVRRKLNPFLMIAGGAALFLAVGELRPAWAL
jgi:chromate transporter